MSVLEPNKHACMTHETQQSSSISFMDRIGSEFMHDACGKRKIKVGFQSWGNCLYSCRFYPRRLLTGIYRSYPPRNFVCLPPSSNVSHFGIQNLSSNVSHSRLRVDSTILINCALFLGLFPIERCAYNHVTEGTCGGRCMGKDMLI